MARRPRALRCATPGRGRPPSEGRPPPRCGVWLPSRAVARRTPKRFARSNRRGDCSSEQSAHNVSVIDGIELECYPEMNKIENRTVAKFEFGSLHASVCASRNVARTRLDRELRPCWRGRSTRVAPQFPWRRGLPEARRCAATASRRRACPFLAAAALRS